MCSFTVLLGYFGKAVETNAGVYSFQDTRKLIMCCGLQARELIVEYGGYEKGSTPVVLGGSMIAGFFASACSLPFDFVKTRMQKMAPNPDGTMPYKGPIDCATQTLQKEGFLKFYTGFPTYCIRIAPHVVITLVILDIINATQKSMGL